MFLRRCFDRLPAKEPDWIPDRFRHHPTSIIFHFSRRLHVLQTFCAAKCRSGFACASGSFGLNFASPPVVHLPFRNKSASAKGKVAVSGGGVRPLAAENVE